MDKAGIVQYNTDQPKRIFSSYYIKKNLLSFTVSVIYTTVVIYTTRLVAMLSLKFKYKEQMGCMTVGLNFILAKLVYKELYVLIGKKKLPTGNEGIKTEADMSSHRF